MTIGSSKKPMKRSPFKRKSVADLKALKTKSLKKRTSKKRTSLAKTKKKADAFFSIYIRMRDADKNGVAECITCGVKRPWKQMQNGHFVSRRVSLLRYDEENCNAQDYSCNVMKHGDLYTYAKNLDLKYGDGTADKLHAQRFTTHKFTIEELESIIMDAKTQIIYYENNP